MNEKHVSFGKKSVNEHHNMDRAQSIRFRTPDDLQMYLERVGKQDLNFQACPISGTPENFHFNSHEQVVTRERDGFSFDTMDDFLCYTFQCDREGYSRTEYIDVKFNQPE
ncbi:MAG: hypothetical protein A4E53_00515 [Pelotomaculum sp. PtaB.Bin104]|nr:MAG: hypothetical protein A4E53_00515 [Pelotomaculum sp. PtaB.Bin104]